MYLGRLVEVGPAGEIFLRPAHPYTKALLAAIPRPDPRLRGQLTSIEGERPSPAAPPSGCRYHPRCPSAVHRCREETPSLLALDGARRAVACHFPL